MQIKQLIEKFIANICQRNYADANNDIKNIIEAKLRQKIATLVEKKASPAQKEARKKFLEKIKAKKKISKKKTSKKVTEEGYEKKSFDNKAFRKLYAGETSGPEKIVRKSSRTVDKTEEYKKRKDAVTKDPLKKTNKKGNK